MRTAQIEGAEKLNASWILAAASGSRSYRTTTVIAVLETRVRTVEYVQSTVTIVMSHDS